MAGKVVEKTKLYVSTVLEELGHGKDKIFFNTLSDIYNKLELNGIITFDEFQTLLKNYLENSDIDFYYETSIADDGEIYINFKEKKEANKFIKLLREKFEKKVNVH